MPPCKRGGLFKLFKMKLVAENTTVGKIFLGVAWFFTVLSGQEISYILSGIASVLAAIYWVIKIKKETKKKQ
jgi:hypothetical protein